ncbi:RNA-guided endonuclease InsQ/TnpB family protein, partial [Shigella sonnei]|uniref:RNA-guided endonuclease InsQ/TnpB family protein n=1 Tax=Shigella sonnei TaxID=624 RepID=UPI00092D6C85
RAKSGLNRSILDQGWYEMRRQLEYKQLWRGGQVLAVPPAYTSQRCACCGHTAKENRLSQSKFRCQVCGYTVNADVNGARNILAAGHARCLLFRQRIQASVARTVVIQRKRTACHKVNSDARYVDIQRTPM